MRKLRGDLILVMLATIQSITFCISSPVKNVKIRTYKAIILPVVLYGCETWSPTLRDDHRQRVFENRVLRRTFGPKKDEMTAGRRKLHNEEFRDLYSSPSIIRIIK
jgi:hypothetical protein